MTDAELAALCSRHGISKSEAAKVLKQVEAELASAPPGGIGMPRDAVGSVMEITAHLNDVIWETRPFNGGEFYSTAQRIIKFFREQARA